MNLWEKTYMNSLNTRKYPDEHYAQLRATLTDLGIAK